MVSAKVESYRDLTVWQKSHEFAVELFKTKFAKKESEPLAAKIRERAAVVAQTIAIGFKRRGKKDKLYRYRGALAAIQELEYLLLLAHDLGLLKNYAKLDGERESIEKMVKGLIHSNSPAPER